MPENTEAHQEPEETTETEEATENVAAEENVEDSGGDSQESDSLDEWKRHSRNWEDRAKANLRDLERVQTERDDLAKKLDEVTAERDRMVTENSRRELVAQVSQETGVDAALLRGSTEEELREHAEAIKSAMIPPKPHVQGYADKPAHSRDETTDFLHNLFKPE